MGDSAGSVTIGQVHADYLDQSSIVLFELRCDIKRYFFLRHQVEETEEPRGYNDGGGPRFERRRRAKLYGAHVTAFKSFKLGAEMLKCWVKNGRVERFVGLATQLHGEKIRREGFVGVFQNRP